MQGKVGDAHDVPQICILDEPSNFLDREALGGLAVAIRDWAGAVVSQIPVRLLFYCIRFTSN